MERNGKIVIFGAGHVGSHCALALAHSGSASEIVLVDSLPEKAAAQALDIADSLVFPPSPVRVRSGDYAEAADADISIVAIGEPRLPGQTRLDLLDRSAALLEGLVERLTPLNLPGIVVTITNPADIVAHLVRQGLGLPRSRCFGTGTLLDTARFVRLLSEGSGVPAGEISGLVLGEHGDSSAPAFSLARLAGRSFDDFLARPPAGIDAAKLDRQALTEGTRQAGMTVIIGKGSTEYGIAQVTAALCAAILGGESAVFPLSVALEGEYGQRGIHAGVPARVGRAGIESIVEYPLAPGEKAAFDASCEVIRGYVKRAQGRA